PQKGPDQRAVLVKRRPPGTVMLLERKRELAPAVELASDRCKRPEAEAAQSLVHVGRPNHHSAYAPVLATPLFGLGPGWHFGHQYAVRFSSPCPRDSIAVRHRGHGRPAAR